ncbi:MAG TPA: NADP-dependent oxidoreductase, partial [Kofleriaceae bacterium]|nr:NADP-dependent oxidoreductase [Kofleriaceae bacterium]
MKAATIHRYGDPDVLRIEDIDAPAVGPRDVLVDVRAAGINPVDCKIRRGGQRAVARYKLPAVLGLDVSGVVAAVGASVTRWAPGDEVFGSPSHGRQGTYAEQVAIDEAQLARKPARISHVEAASLPLVGLTAWQCLVGAARLAAGDKVLIQAGSGGVGTFAIQLARHLGAEVATTCSERNAAFVRELGATVVIDHTRERFDEVLTNYDVVLESIGGDDLRRASRVLRRGGKLVYITTNLADHGERYGPTLGAAIVASRIAWRWLSSRLRGKPATVVVRKPDGEQLALIGELVDRGAITPIV